MLISQAPSGPQTLFVSCSMLTFMTKTRGYLPGPVDPNKSLKSSNKSKKTTKVSENAVPARPSGRAEGPGGAAPGKRKTGVLGAAPPGQHPGYILR